MGGRTPGPKSEDHGQRGPGRPVDPCEGTEDKKENRSEGKKGAKQKQQMQKKKGNAGKARARSEALAERASEACEAPRGAWAPSSGSTSSRAAGVTSEEPTVEGTRGEPIGVAILPVARRDTSSNLVWARKTAAIGRLEQQSTIGCRGPTAYG